MRHGWVDEVSASFFIYQFSNPKLKHSKRPPRPIQQTTNKHAKGGSEQGDPAKNRRLPNEGRESVQVKESTRVVLGDIRDILKRGVVRCSLDLSLAVLVLCMISPLKPPS